MVEHPRGQYRDRARYKDGSAVSQREADIIAHVFFGYRHAKELNEKVKGLK